MCGLSLFAAYRAEKLGSPVFPYFPNLPLICSQTPTRPPHLTNNDALVLPQHYELLRLRY